MKKNEQPKPDASFTPLHKAAEPEQEFMFHIPPGVKFSDIYMDLQGACAELKVCKRIITNMRRAGKLSYTYLDEKGKIYYFRQEIAAILQANVVIGKNSPSARLA